MIDCLRRATLDNALSWFSPLEFVPQNNTELQLHFYRVIGCVQNTNFTIKSSFTDRTGIMIEKHNAYKA